MQAVNKAVIRGYLMMENLQEKAVEYAARKEEGIDGFVVAIIIIVIAIAIGSLFKTQISNFITSFFQKFATQTQNLF